MRNGLMLHCGGEAVTEKDLDLFPVPQETATYKPVSHFELVKQIKLVSQDLLTLRSGGEAFQLERESFGVAREGKQMFGVLTFVNSDTEQGLSVGFRNSYDKSMALGIVMGTSVFVCDNLCLSGEISIMRKHTRNVWDDIHQTLITSVYTARKVYHQNIADASAFKALPMPDDDAFGIIGRLYGNDIISPRQLAAVFTDWKKPRYEEFAPRNAWSLYNACTEALKTSPPVNVMENHVNLHRYFTGLTATMEERPDYYADRAADLTIDI